MRFAGCIEADCICHTVRGEDAIGKLREEAVAASSAARTFAGCWIGPDCGRTRRPSKCAGAVCLYCKAVRAEQSIRTVEVQVQQRGRRHPWSDFPLSLSLRAQNIGILAR